MYEAWETEDKKERIKLAREALSIAPDCADAYNLLAEEDAKTLKEATEFYRKDMEAGRRTLGEEIFKDNDGHFWGWTPSRPYMRSRLGYVECLWEDSDLKEALKSNQYVPEYLSGKKSIPQILPDMITMHGEDGGFCYASRYLKAWQKVSGAIDWLKEKAGIKIIPKTERNELCPCGSGKKYKKCCGD